MVARVLRGTCAAVVVVAALAGCGSHGTAAPAEARTAPVVAPPSFGYLAGSTPTDTRAGGMSGSGAAGATGSGGAAAPGGNAGTDPAGSAAPVGSTSCAASALSLSQPPGGNAAAGQVVVAVRVANHASRPCVISGYPAFTLTAPRTGGADVAEPVVQQHGSLGSLAFGDPVRAVTIPAGGFSGFLLRFSQIPYGDGGCVAATKLRLTLPGAGAGALVTGPVQIMVCGEPMLVSPFVPSDRLAVG
ncbi:DUF4232 domain-containing protein [Rugosimonospora africana]|uniref:DUF4232 domain-containing protein n=1 Tax=Rugosimonospora africana TaxID=556532 RepID=A0A8J3R2I7_9ACTN|nr:DUF4232 domain-containing protein [Rugosimonospora africana]GIH20483.1 hypothetical protein Raf01_86550 [Rugosimonospora africana]